jgi:hypothetical protein
VPPLVIGSRPVNVMLGVVPPEDAILPEPVTAVTVPPEEGDVLVIVWSGHVPLTAMPVPATRWGVVVPVPPSATGTGTAMEMLGVVPPDEASGLDAVTDVTPPPPPDADMVVVPPADATDMPVPAAIVWFALSLPFIVSMPVSTAAAVVAAFCPV